MLFFKYISGLYQGADHTGRRVLNVGGGGGGGPTESTVTQSNIPDWLRPQTEALLGAATQEYFTTTPRITETGETVYDITGLRPFTPYSDRPEDYVAGFTPGQQDVFAEAARMSRPDQFKTATGATQLAGLGGYESARAASSYGALGTEYGQSAAEMGMMGAAAAEARADAAQLAARQAAMQGQQSGMLGQELGVSGGEYFGGMGAGYGAQAASLSPYAQYYGGQAAGMAPEAQAYGRTAADIGAMGLRAEDLGRDVGGEAREYARQAAGMGSLYEQMATRPETVQAYMSPYQQSVIDIAKEQAIEDAQRAQLGANLGAVRQGTYGGARQTLAQSQREAALNKQLSDIQTQGLQSAYDRAMQAQQFGVSTGLQGLQGAQAGLGTALQGGQLGLSGIGQALAGQQAGLSGLGQAGQLYGEGLRGLQQAGQLYSIGQQGAQTGLQGVQQQLAGTGQGMQGSQIGLSGVDRLLAAGQLGLSGTAQGIQGAQAGMQGAQVGLQGVTGAQAGYGLLGREAASMANIGQQQQASDLARMQFQNEIAALPQQQQQQIIDQAIQNYALAQESPFQRLAGYSGLVRGYATPTTTVEQYSAPASPLSQLAGASAALYGASQPRGREGGKIEEGIDTALIKKMKRKSRERKAA